MTDLDRVLKLRMSGVGVLTSETIDSDSKPYGLLTIRTCYSLQKFFGDVNADNLTDQLGECETIHIYLGQVILCVVSHESNRM